MRLLSPLIVPPLIFLILQSVNYALEPWACEHQTRFPMHATAMVALAIALAGAALAWREWHARGRILPDDGAGTDSSARFLAVVGLMVSAFSALAIAALWMTQFVVPPCVR